MDALNRCAVLNLLLTLCLPCAGCSGKPKIYEVRPDTARQTLVTALTGWKSGLTPEALRGLPEGIVVQDPDWQGGARLQDFALLSDGTPVGANLSVEVRLDLVEKKNATVSRRVWYLVGTDPALTVFRDLFH